MNKSIVFYLSWIACFACNQVFAQSEVQTLAQSSAGGAAQEGAINLITIFGQPSPIGLDISGDDTLFSGALYVFDEVAINRPPIIDSVLSVPSPPSVSQNIVVRAKITDDFGVASATVNFRMGGQMSFTSLSMTASGNIYQAAIPGNAVNSFGVEYFIATTDIGSLRAQTPKVSIQVLVPDPGVVKANAQPAGSEQTAYRLFSMPLEADDKSRQAVLDDDLGAYDSKKWRAAELRSDYLNLPADQHYRELTATAQIIPGTAYWLLVKDAGKIIDTGAGKSKVTDKEYQIVLHPGWNFIATPFNFEIPLSKLRFKQPLDVRFYNGAWNDYTASLQPFEGYAIFNNAPASDTLLVNPDLSTSSPLNKDVTANKTLWSIRILAQCQQARDEDNFAAIVAGASEGFDAQDRPEPPVIGQYVSVYFPHFEWDAPGLIYCVDTRPEFSDKVNWSFEVTSNIRDKVLLTFEGIEQVPEEFEVWVIDDRLKLSQNLREKNAFVIAGTSPNHPKPLKLVVGRHDFIAERLAKIEAIPAAYELSQNFPNPFNPLTAIRYGLPQAGQVTLKIYNLLGEEVATLADRESKAAGYHLAIWNGRDHHNRPVASGVYVYRLNAGGVVIKKKMALLK